MALKCGQCGNRKGFFMVWDNAIVTVDVDEHGEQVGEPEISGDVWELEGDIECPVCGVRHLIMYEEEE